VAAWLVEELWWRATGWLFLDPWKNFASWSHVGINDSDGVGRLSIRIQEIQAAANLSMIVIPMHTTQARAEDGEERGKGAGELEDGADALWRYTKERGGHDAPRFLSVIGRGGAYLEASEVVFDQASYALEIGTRTRAEARKEYQGQQKARSEMTIADLIYAHLMRPENVSQGKEKLKYSELEAIVPGSAGAKTKKIKAAVESGEIIMEPEGRGKPTWYYPSVEKTHLR